MCAVTSLRLIPLLLFMTVAPSIAAPAGLDTSILPALDAQGKWGYVDAVSGKTLIAPQFREAGFFYDGVAIVTRAYPNEAYDKELVDSVYGRDIAARAIPTGQGLIDRNGREILPAQYDVERANTDSNMFSNGRESKGVYIPRLFFVRTIKNQTAVFHADKGFVVPQGKHKDIRFTLEGGVYCDDAYYEPDGKRHDPPSGCGITHFEPKTGTFLVVKGKGIKEMNAPEGIMRQDGSLIVPIKYDDVHAAPEAGIWLACRGDAMPFRAMAFALTRKVPEIKDNEDIVTVDVYDASGKVLRSFRARYHPSVSGTTYTYKSKGIDYWVDARTGAAVPDKKKELKEKEDKEKEPQADPETGFQPFKEDGKYGIKNAAGADSVPPTYDAMKNLGGGLFAVSHKKIEYRNNWGVIDGAGKEIIPLIYYSIHRVSYPSPTTTTGPLVCEQYTGDSYKGWTPVQRVGQPAPPPPKDIYWFVGRDGHFITAKDKPYHDYPVDFSFNAAGLVVVERDNKYGVVDYTGKEVLPCAYDTVKDELKSTENKKRWSRDEDTTRKSGSGGNAAKAAPLTAKDALFRVQSGGLWGVYNGSGKEIIPFQYEKSSLQWFADAGVLAVWQNGKWALFDKTGRQLHPFIYDGIKEAVGPFVWGEIKKEQEMLDGKPVVYWDTGILSIKDLVDARKDNKVLIDGTGREYRIGLP